MESNHENHTNYMKAPTRNSRDRVIAALSFERTDRVPFDFWASKGFYRIVKAQQGLDPDAFLDKHDVDLRYIAGPRYIGPPLKSDGEEEADLWGVPREVVSVATSYGWETYHEVVDHPLADARTPDDVARYHHWPSADWFDYSVVRVQCEAIRARGRAVVFMGDRLNRIAQLKPAMYLRGVERILFDLASDRKMAEAIIVRIKSFYCDYLERILEAADGLIDLVMTGDDFGSQKGLLISPAMWSDYFEDGFRCFVDIVHRHGSRLAHHTCGMVIPLVGKLVECGLDVLQSLQPEAMAAHFLELKDDFGDRLAFHGGMSIQKTLPHSTPQEVRTEVFKHGDMLAPGGGYIFGTAHNVQADCPLQNVEALLKAYREYGLLA